MAIDPKFRTFADGCTWPDVFPRQRSPEHYVDLQRSAKGIEPQRPCPLADRCVISAILNDTRDLALSLDVSDQLRLLKSLGHWVGDIHQPLHLSFDDDRGGNLIAIEGPCRFNLHAVWDACIIEKKIGLDYAVIAAKLRAEITGRFPKFENLEQMAATPSKAIVPTIGAPAAAHKMEGCGTPGCSLRSGQRTGLRAVASVKGVIVLMGNSCEPARRDHVNAKVKLCSS